MTPLSQRRLPFSLIFYGLHTRSMIHTYLMSIIPTFPFRLCDSFPSFSARAAARLACACRGFRAAHAESWWPTLDPATGNVLEPRSGRFWRELSPGDDVRAAVGACPEGGCILLRPGVHALVPQGEVGLDIHHAVTIFGRGLATVQSPGCTYAIFIGVHLPDSPFALDGLIVRTVNSEAGLAGGVGVLIAHGSPRLQSCAITGPTTFGLLIISDSPSPPVITNCRCGGRGDERGRSRCAWHHLGLFDVLDSVHGAKFSVLTLRRIDGSTDTGVFVSNNSRPRLIGNEIWGNRMGITIGGGGDPFLSANTIRDHAGANGRGVVVKPTSLGRQALSG